jgi:hypothetical protein
MMDKKQSTERCAVAFSDHLTLILHTKFLETTTTWGRGLWKMNVSMLQIELTRTLFKDDWGRWKMTRHKYTKSVAWWWSCVKPKLRAFFLRMCSERASDFQEMNKFLQKNIYDLLTVHRDCSDKYRELKTLKAKIVRLHAQH